MANKSTKRHNRALRKKGEHFHGTNCDTRGNGCNFPKLKEHPFAAQRDALIKARGYEL